MEWACHCLVVVGILVGIRLLEAVTSALWGPSEVQLFSMLPLRYVFDAADLGLLVGLLTYGIFRVIVTYRA
jgi:hypothetical protein